MKIAFLSGAYKNAGDFLIEKRALNLLKKVYPDAEIDRSLRNQITENIDRINGSDCIVFGGGPIYKKNLDGYLPLDICIHQMKKPVFILGGGCYGTGTGTIETGKYSFASGTLEFLKKADETGALGCRDLISCQVLKNRGLKNVFMTGCPAWYDLDCLDSSELRTGTKTDRIVISDPAQKQNLSSCLKLVDYVKGRYPNAQITFVFHRGREGRKSFCDALKARHIDMQDIAGSSDGFHVYDDCDLHIGYRVHAHIYNLSIRNKTVLIEEDGRGGGVNQAVGLPQIKSYNDNIQSGVDFFSKAYKRMPFYENKGMISQLDTYLDVLESTGYQYIKNAFVMQQRYFESMISFVEKMR